MIKWVSMFMLLFLLIPLAMAEAKEWAVSAELNVEQGELVW